MNQTTTVTRGFTAGAWLTILFSIVLIVGGLYAAMAEVAAAGALLFIAILTTAFGSKGAWAAVGILVFFVFMGNS